ncbi:degradation arginine-rich protein for mis-folding-domain-containing protein [Pavlovales sp. CCMP2436]|nr:degradation arginine-rich protein for mis-folding-domain-containing protein [Pavlovales sp. CCMP2436]
MRAVWFAVLALCAGGALAAKDENECEVCNAVLSEIDLSLSADVRKDVLKVEQAMQTYCDASSGKHKQMCYYMGIADKREISGSFSRGINAKRLCSRLKKMDQQMCELKFEKVIDINGDLNKLKVKDLRKKGDFIRAINKYLGKAEL